MPCPEHPSFPQLSRRSFLGLTLAALLTACGTRGERPRIGLALGGGGAKGLAHISMLEVFDELKLRPYRIAGTSIGAIVGALYAAGLTASHIRALVEQFLLRTEKGDNVTLHLPRSLRWLDFIDPELARGGLLDSDDFIAFLGEVMPARHFGDLEIPLQVVTAELWSGAPVVLDHGELLPALQASMALPGLFAPVTIDGRQLVDGGVVDPLPYDLLMQNCDVVVAIDVSGAPDTSDGALSFAGVLMHSFHTMSRNILAEKLRQQRPQIYVKPDIRDIRLLEFYKAEQIFVEAQAAKTTLRRTLEKAARNQGRTPGCSYGKKP